MAYDPRVRSGVHVAAGHVEGTAFAQVITAPGAGGGPHVRVFNGLTGLQSTAPSSSFFAYGAGFFGGVWVASADVNLDGRADIITAPGAGGGPHINVFSGAHGGVINTFFAYAPGFLGGVRVGASDVDNNGRPDILTSPGPGGGPHIRAFHGDLPFALATGASSFQAYPGGFAGGVFVAGGRNQTLSLIETPDTIAASQTLALIAETPSPQNEEQPPAEWESSSLTEPTRDAPTAESETTNLNLSPEKMQPGESPVLPALDDLFADDDFLSGWLSLPL